MSSPTSSWSDLLPKEPIQTSLFHTLLASSDPDYKPTKYDGSNITVAILDTGVDLNIDGLRWTTEGTCKIIEALDTSGSGDVELEEVKQVEEREGMQIVKGLSGRELKLGNWKNPTKKYYIGLKSLYDLCPADLITRLKSERRKIYDMKSRSIETSLMMKIKDCKNTEEKTELETQLSELLNLDKNYEDVGPLLDCIVFHDGINYNAVIDTLESGDLMNIKPLTSYGINQDYSLISQDSMLYYCVQIQDNILTIVTNAGSHGSHVAGIVAANYPNQPELNGIAPGAKIVSIKIGDSRLGSMETLPSLIRALNEIKKRKIDIVNVSYGEPSMFSDGRFTELVSELINKYGVIFVSSAGNDGPALNTVGAPGGTVSAIIGVGAYVSPEMAAVEYSINDSSKELSEGLYTWSSRGPSNEGGIGVSICAPGGAITCVPAYKLCKSMLMNGTSMASPNACGGITLLLSALKSSGISYTPHKVKSAIELSARKLPGESFGQGFGLLQIANAWKFIKENDTSILDVQYDISLSNKLNGIYIREEFESKNISRVAVTISPKFDLDASAVCFSESPADKSNSRYNNQRLAYETRCKLIVRGDGDVSWVSVPDYFQLVHGGRAFVTQVDPAKLSHGSHFARVCGYDESNPNLILFTVPVTVIIPHPSSLIVDNFGKLSLSNMAFTPGKIERLFYSIPNSCHWVKVTATLAKPVNFVKRFVLHAVQRILEVSHRELEYQQYFTMEGHNEQSISFEVRPGYTLEICLAQFWNSLGESLLNFEVEFHGLSPCLSEISFDQTASIKRVDVISSLFAETVKPTCVLKKVRSTIIPASSEIVIYSKERDTMWNDRQTFSLILSYNFILSEKSNVTLISPLLNGALYEALIEGPFYMIFNSNKRLLGSGDAWPKTHSLDKGNYTARLIIRHQNKSYLETFKDMKIFIEKPLDKDISAAIYDSPHNALTGGKKFSEDSLLIGQTTALYLSFPAPSKGLNPGDILTGHLQLEKNEAKNVKKFDITYTVTNTTLPPKANATSSPPLLTFNEELRDNYITFLSKVKKEKRDEAYNSISPLVLSNFPDYLPLLSTKLLFLDEASDRSSKLNEIVDLSNYIINLIDQKDIAAYFGKIVDSKDSLFKGYEEKKKILIDALYRKAGSYRDLSDQTLLDLTLKELKSWVDINKESLYFQFLLQNELKAKNYGAALKLLNEKIATSQSEGTLELSYLEQRVDILKNLEWNHIVDSENRSNVVRFPKSYTLF